MQLAGVAELERLPAEAYTAEASAAVYQALYTRAAAGLAAGQAVIVDAVFSRPEERKNIEAVARAADVTFQGLWLDADPAVMAARVTARRGDASDARSEEHTSELQSLMRISYAVFCLKKKNKTH